ncbi:MAG: GNAT family N-acetyltransferase [Chloroflexota bacterium]
MIVGERVRLRPVKRDDLHCYVDWFSDPQVRRYMDKVLPVSLAQQERWFEDLQERIQRREVVMLAIETRDGTHIGNISLFDINWKDRGAELGITIGNRDYWSQGYGCDSVRTMLGLAFRDLNFHRVCLRVHGDNIRGIRCYEKAGFKKEGTLRESVFRDGTYLDVIVMGILRSEFEAHD